MIAGCNQLCVNTIGSSECLCQNGYKLSDDDRTCVGRCSYVDGRDIIQAEQVLNM